MSSRKIRPNTPASSCSEAGEPALLGRGSGARAVAGFRRAFGDMDLTIDDLEVGSTPKRQQLRPGQVSIVTPDLEERGLVVDFRGAEQPPAGFAASSRLQPAQQSCLSRRCVPQYPRRDAAGVPRRTTVWVSVQPEIAMPAVAVDRLAANAAVTWAAMEARFAKWGWRSSEAARQTFLATRGYAPRPTKR